MRPLNILTWHTHGSYLYYLSQAPHNFFVLSKPDRPPGYLGRYGHLPWGPNVHDMPVAKVKQHAFDCILFQDDAQYEHDQYEWLSAAQRALPRIYLEHDPPQSHPTDTRHPVDDPNVLLVHVTHFNELMWQNGRSPTRVIEHGVMVPDEVQYSGELTRGLVVINNLASRGRRLGADLFNGIRDDVALDLVGMGAHALGGLGEVQHAELPQFAARYRYLFSPIRYASLGLAVLEAMTIGLPVVALATTEMATVIRHGVSGFIGTKPAALADYMRELARDRDLARAMGTHARHDARERFGIERFAADWDDAFRQVAGPARNRGSPR